MRNLKFIKNYICSIILPQYIQNDNSHSISHVKYVVKRATRFAKILKCDISIIYVAASYHDIGHHIDPQTHEIISANIFMQDGFICEWFSLTERQLIKEAIEDHRASNKNIPRNIYGEILSSADRTTSVLIAINRSVIFNIDHCENADEGFIHKRVFNYLQNKYGCEGYSKIFVKDKRYFRFIKKMKFLLDHKMILEKIIDFQIAQYVRTKR